MNKLLPLMALLAVTEASAIEQDKLLHFGVSSAIGGVTMYHTEDWGVSVGACMAVGLGKELYDEYDYGGFDAEDLAYDALGCISGVMLVDYGLKLEASKNSVAVNWSYDFD
ncbi:hypothetical protein NVP1167O_62 [Vibrio phage 1.167.O._10N.261.51.F2]|nr:hypothetical protein NVP1167O_62 [Vibrio phage 1.167.O._10N.261.51.F2]